MLRDDRDAGLAGSASWQGVLARFASASLAEVSDTAVASRQDTKFLLHAEDLLTAISELNGNYRVLDIDGTRFSRYQTQYFDTESFALFRRHHAGGSNRCKLRTRYYENTGHSFLEVKRKTGNRATTKLRLPTPEFETDALDRHRSFVEAHCPYPVTAFRPTLRNRFDRITLINESRGERLTIDLDLGVEQTGNAVLLPGVAVAELKQEPLEAHWRQSEFLAAMRAIGVRPTGFSKYCIGLLLARTEIKHNLFKPQLKRLRRLMGESNAVV